MSCASDRLHMEHLVARVADWCTACHFFPLFQAKWLASPRLRTISFDAKLFSPWNVANLTLLMEYKLKWRMSHLPYLFKRKIFALNLTFFIVSRMEYIWSHRLGLAKKERTTDSSVWAAQTAQFYSLESSDSECSIHTWSMHFFPNFFEPQLLAGCALQPYATPFYSLSMLDGPKVFASTFLWSSRPSRYVHKSLLYLLWG